MDSHIENLVELYVTRGGKVFVSPQYDVEYDKERNEGGARPTFSLWIRRKARSSL